MPSPNPPEIVVGVVGSAASGKDTVANELTRYGYNHTSSSDCVRDEIHARGKTPSRSLQTEIANEMRNTHGAGYWVDRSLQTVGDSPKVVISGIYSPGEGHYIKDEYHGSLIGVIASLDPEKDLATRFQRLADRADGTRDALTFEEFKAAQERESSGTEMHQTNIAELLKIARFTIINSAGLVELRSQVADVVSTLEASQ
jgi:dephospho-CoA kinase